MNAALLILFLATTLSSQAFALEVYGHRGARARFPENTLPAFEYAMKLGADYLEMDMAVTKDGEIVISHDPHISAIICLDPSGKRITSPPLIHTLTLAEVKEYDCGTLKNPRFSTQTPVPGTRIPTLHEVFEMTEKSDDPQAKKIRFNIETKIFKDHPEYAVDPDTFVRLFLKVVRAHRMQDRVILQSFDFRTLTALRKYEQKIPTVALVRDAKIDMVAAEKDSGFTILSPDYALLSAPLVEKLHMLGARVVPWTVDDPKEWPKLIEMKVDGIITDDPAALIDYLSRWVIKNKQASQALNARSHGRGLSVKLPRSGISSQ